MSGNPKDGGAAFPSSNEDGDLVVGMTLRDWFAGQALIGLLSQGSQTVRWHNENGAIAYQAADAMLAHRALIAAEETK
ncbi:MAG: hypothetical protein Q8R92_01060 [Deltaproteobacteria bacterium]|nr:hypothetical protein [Deltaproteobacteria bacterium]